MSDENKKILLTTRDGKDYTLEEFLENPEVLRIIEAASKRCFDKPKGTWHHKSIIISPSEDLYK